MTTATAHPNIALVKYWGKQDRDGNLPATPNLSITLSDLITTTTVVDAGQERDDADDLDILSVGEPGRELTIEPRAREAPRIDAETVRDATGFAIGGVAPVGHATRLPLAIDASLGRFETIHAAAGHPHCVFATTLDELVRITGGTPSDGLTS